MKYKYLLLILILGLGLRLINLNQSLWLDEASQALLSSASPFKIWGSRGGDFHPPLFYFLAYFWLQLARTETWLRLLPVIFGVLNLLVIYQLAHQLFPHQKFKLGPTTLNSGHLASFLLAIAPFHIYYSQEFRSYSLLCFLGTLSMYFFFRRRYSWLALTDALLLYTHYSSIFLILTQLIIQPSVFPYLSLTTILYLPWLPQFAAQLHTGTNLDSILPGWRQVLSVAPLKAFPVVVFKLVAGRINFLNRYVYSLYIIFVFTVTFSALWLAKNKKRLLFSWALVPVFIMLSVSFIFPQNQPFRVIFVLPAFLLLFIQAIGRHPKLFLTFIIYISIVGNAAYYTRPRLQREQWRQALDFLSHQSGLAVVKFPQKFAPFDWYAPTLPVLPALPDLPAQPTAVTSTLTRGLPESGSVFLLEYLTGLTDPDRLVDSALESRGYRQTRIYNFEGVGFIYEYVK